MNTAIIINNYQWQSWNREERIYNPHDKKTNPFKVARKKTERCLYKSETSDTKKAMNKETFEPYISSLNILNNPDLYHSCQANEQNLDALKAYTSDAGRMVRRGVQK